MRLLLVMDYSEDDGSTVMTGYRAPEGFQVPDDWEAIEYSAFIPSLPSDEQTDAAEIALGITTHDGTFV